MLNRNLHALIVGQFKPVVICHSGLPDCRELLDITMHRQGDVLRRESGTWETRVSILYRATDGRFILAINGILKNRWHYYKPDRIEYFAKEKAGWLRLSDCQTEMTGSYLYDQMKKRKAS